MTSDERKLQELLARVLERHQHKASVRPSWLATETMVVLDPKKVAPQLVYRAAHLQLRQMARALCRREYGEDAGGDGAQHSLFPGLQARYPVARSARDADPEYVQLEHLKSEDVGFNVARLRKESRAKLKHADALEAVHPDGPTAEIAEAVLKALDAAMGMEPSGKPSPEMYEGIHSPVYCPRGLDDCESLNQIVAAGHKSFICCGEHGQGKIPQDRYRLCFKNAEIDDMQDYDSRDVIQTAAVLMGAAAVIVERTAASEIEAD